LLIILQFKITLKYSIYRLIHQLLLSKISPPFPPLPPAIADDDVIVDDDDDDGIF
jgi:hypothetical protein